MLSLVPSYISAKPRERIIKTGKGVLAACELHPERSLAEHYNPLAMAPELLKAHDALDREVDKAMEHPANSLPSVSVKRFCSLTT